ncbi:MAG: OFA family MFS transporter [Candidatus Methanofastidiosa archaeon]|nr:OFA family MFS transporter [Candidatus Methanofastidiosa archaeon]
MKEKSRWIFVIVGFLINLCLGSVYSWSVFRKPLEDFFKIRSITSGLPFMIFLSAYAFFMPFAGRLIRRNGPCKVAFIGSLMVGIGWMISGYATNIFQIILSYGLVAGMGVGIVYGTPLAVIAKWFPEKNGFATGLVLAGFGLSPLISAPFINLLIEQKGPLISFKIIGLLFLILISVLSLILKYPDDPIHIDKIENSRKELKIERDIETKVMVKMKSFYGLWLSFALGTMVGLMIIGISKPVALEEIGLSKNTATAMLSIFALSNGLGRPLFGWIVEKMLPRKTAILTFLFICFASLLMMSANHGDKVKYFISFVLFWLCFGAWLSIAPITNILYFGRKSYTENYGILFTAYGVGAIVGNLLSGFCRDITGNYQSVFLSTLLIGFFGLVISIFFIQSPRG